MNQLIPNAQATMSSREISELTGSRHGDVIKSIKRLVKRGVIGEPQRRSSSYINNLGHSVPTDEYVFTGDKGKRDSIISVAQLCPEFTARLVDRWQELEQQVSQPQLPQTMAEALRLAADQAERLEQQQRELQEAAPKIAFANRVSVAHDAITVAEAAKTIGTGRTRLFAFLRHHGWVNRRNEPYQAKIEAGLMDVKVSQWEHPKQGLKESITALIAGKGLIKLQLLWESSKGDAA